MEELKFWSPDEIRKRVDAWVAEMGPEGMAKMAEKAQKAREEVREAFRLDYETLNKPTTI